ncbi:hypothetical protein [Thermomonospora umbrina]|uniref:hypothetical protein n=1 Tax=Thermomonospora umbrina TaxID=111806 RepID=UPI000E256A3B|nr:hypothetical protein [Thermomonospora umbrina]
MLNKLKKVGRLEYLIIAGVAIAATAVANVPGMYSAASNWRSRISSELDKPGNQQMQALKTASAKDWIADDQKAFASAVDAFISDLETCRKYAEAVGGAVDSVAGSYTKYWTSLGNLVGSAFALLIPLTIYKLLPTPAGVIARIISATIGIMVVACIINMTAALQSFISAASNVFSQLTVGGRVIQLENLKPTGGAAIKFNDAKINWSPPSTYVEPKRNQPAPYGK